MSRQGTERHGAQSRLELPDKTIGVVPDEDHTSGELNPAQITLDSAIEPASNPPELGQKRMATLHRTTNPTYPSLPRLATLGGFHSQAGCVNAGLGRPIAIRPVRPRPRQVPHVRGTDGRLGRRRLDDQRLQHRLGLHAILGIGSGKDGPQRHPVSVARYVDGNTGLTAIHRRWPGVFTPFFDGFLEPSRRT
jgi:hypothetical protein